MESTTLHETTNLDEDTSSKNTKKNKEFSEIWKYFQKRGVGKDGIERAECKACNNLYRCGAGYGTSTMWRHTESCKKMKIGDIVDDEGSSYPTSNLYFMQVWKIQLLLQENVLSDDLVIMHMCLAMKEKFDKYWSEYSLILALGAVLDPRIKLSMLSYFYSKVEMDKVNCQKMVSLVKSKLYELFEHYDVSKNTSSSTQSVGISKTHGKRILDEIISYESQALTNAGKSQLDIYLEEPKYGFADHENLNVLEFWKTHQQRFSSLALMAADVLAIPITTVASESAFSIGYRVLTNYRSCILPSKVQALICTRNWLHNFPCDFEEESLLIKKTVSESSSNVSEPIDVDEDEDTQEEEEDEQEIFNLVD